MSAADTITREAVWPEMPEGFREKVMGWLISLLDLSDRVFAPSHRLEITWRDHLRWFFGGIIERLWQWLNKGSANEANQTLDLLECPGWEALSPRQRVLFFINVGTVREEAAV